MSSLRTWFIFLVGLLTILATGCASTRTIRIYEATSPTDTIRYLGVSTVQLLYESELLESNLRTHRLLGFLAQRTQWPIAPSNEFSIINHLERDPIRKTDLLLRLKPTKGLGNQIALLETTISLREAKGRAIINASTGTLVGRAHEIDLVVRMTVTGKAGAVLFDVESVTRVDPFAITPDFDSRSYIDNALSSLLEILIRDLDEHIQPVTKKVTFVGRPTMSGLKSYPSRSVTSHDSRQMDGMELDIRNWHILQYSDFSASIDEAKKDLLRNVGFCLTQDHPNTTLKAGDCIYSIDGKAVANSHQIQMKVNEKAKNTFRMQIQRRDTASVEQISYAPE